MIASFRTKNTLGFDHCLQTRIAKASIGAETVACEENKYEKNEGGDDLHGLFLPLVVGRWNRYVESIAHPLSSSSCTKHLHSLSPHCALHSRAHLLDRLLTSSRVHEKGEYVYKMNASVPIVWRRQEKWLLRACVGATPIAISSSHAKSHQIHWWRRTSGSNQ